MKSFVFTAVSFLFVFSLTVQCNKEVVNAEEWLENHKEDRVINLSNKEVGVLPKSIGNLTKVEELTLQYDSLKKLPKEIGNLKQLKILNLFGNPLQTLPDEIGNLEHLEVLLLGRTELREIPPVVGRLQKLKTLALDETKVQLTEADVEVIAALPHLEILDLSLMREYKTLPKNLAKLNHLKQLVLQKTLLEKIDVIRLRDELPKVRVKL
ncbi:leucine-rich repeat domain-containing protein [Leptospira sp. 2 VSF19]|uniref:Leucine-rich repeat domain-containing protein n=1 Tax=Leptospira soteropolitanensis TaxID=2950025 RepID=A0AAW5VFR6_9LEPT|nr:leucine-rich repeat domain-containing protein [Leptospira soteropolitanensis]MCW7493782.1 leucine-rich repeat domain-containing protein [Leptospira soteropolitanensis]MCW7501380.1 leucine-rich repeat domain-containing protein [Leptospira soteropolitanensis]MCW7523434.1 leucine-rich repeat domain-containing protein [Leptospira soteropolitanensis]MCW7527494.1 leucine-rich repeat domain-containing protein [Leptospira soteropolitanensis]MCW7531350.1 leucine-rich repeat domain-containing protein